MKRKVFITFICVILLLGLIFGTYHIYWKPSDWTYSGKAVVLTTDSIHKFIETTDVSLNGEVYGFGKYFLGDLRIGIIEKEKHFYGEPDFITKGMMTDYHYYLNKMGESYFATKKVRKQFELRMQEAQTNSHPESIPDTKMFYFMWREWFGGRADNEYLKWGRFHFKKAGSELFVIETSDYLIVPGVSTRREALELLHENFPYLDWYGFEQALGIED